MIVMQGFGAFWWCKASLYCILRNCWKKLETWFSLSKHLEKRWAPRLYYKQAAAIESVTLRWLVVVARARLEEIGEIGLKSALATSFLHLITPTKREKNLHPKAMITYTRPTRIGQIFTN